ncbi:MAG: ferritin family protein [Bacteroidetes bacterium]|nr:ferritin family protein [Bacteroidota bacterium]
MGENNIDKLIDFAIAQEHEAYAFYKAAAEKVTNPGVKQLFQELAEDENGHANLLEMYRENKVLGEIFKTLHIDYKITETQDLPSLSLSMKPAEAITIAMKKELQAAELYRAFAANAVNNVEREALENLANMEMGHKHKLENAFINIGYPEVF